LFFFEIVFFRIFFQAARPECFAQQNVSKDVRQKRARLFFIWKDRTSYGGILRYYF